MAVTDDVVGVVIPTAITVPTKVNDQSGGKAGNLFLSNGKLYFNPTDGGAAEIVTSS